jgi:hypothetical protein
MLPDNGQAISSSAEFNADKHEARDNGTHLGYLSSYLAPRVATREAFPAITSIYKTDKGAHSWSSAFERLNDGSERTLEA